MNEAPLEKLKKLVKSKPEDMLGKKKEMAKKMPLKAGSYVNGVLQKEKKDRKPNNEKPVHYNDGDKHETESTYRHGQGFK